MQAHRYPRSILRHRRLFNAWADADELEPFAVPGVDETSTPPWRFLRALSASSLDPTVVPAPRSEGRRPPTLHLTVLLGLTGQGALLDLCRKKIKSDPNREPRRSPTGDCFSASVGVDSLARPAAGTLLPSRLVLLVRNLGQGLHLEGALRRLSHDVEDELRWFDELSQGDLGPDELWTSLVDRWASISVAVNAPPSRAFVAAKVFGQWVRAGEEPEPAGTGSFFAADLRTLARRELNDTLRSYLSGTPGQPPAGAIDLGDREEQARRLPAGSGPVGRWSSIALTTSQRIVVTNMSDRLHADGSDIVAVNGPPGTGKSTLLRELVAQQIVKRADVIAALGPDRAFTPSEVRRRRVFTVHPTLTGFEMVVASSNNKAVENVAAVLNHRRAMPEGFPVTHLSGLNRAHEEAWALICLVLGRRDNVGRATKLVAPRRSSDLWSNQLRADGLPPWPMAFEGFLRARERVERLEADARRHAAERERLRPIVTWLAGTVGEDPATWSSFAESKAREFHDQLQRIKLRRPGWLARQLATSSWKRWSEDHQAAEQGLHHHRELKADVATWLRYRSVAHLGADEWLALAPVDRERRPPNLDRELELARVQVFAAALQLHGAALATQAAAVDQTMDTWAWAMIAPAAFTSEQRLSLWRSLFMDVPVVTTTFASAGRMLSDFGSNGLGTVVVDEAGQAPAHQAVPILAKARRAAVVGDPQQLDPIVTLEPELLHPVMRAAGADVRWSPERVSVQHLADAASPVGTQIDLADHSTWVGLPLRGHFRCAMPMFELSNTLSYGGKMVLLRAAEAAPLSILKGLGSVWIQAPPATDSRHWGPEDRKILVGLINDIVEPPVDDLFVIAPFRETVHLARAAVTESRDRGGPEASGSWRDWARSHIGTIHTFQGREADTVILMLSVSARKQGARDWAAKQPNLLNVAVTRAKERLIVVGDHDAWSSLRHFDGLAARLQLKGPDDLGPPQR